MFHLYSINKGYNQTVSGNIYFLMDHYKNFELSDFLVDDFFCQWVLNPTEEIVTSWQNWLDKHPEKMLLVEHAKSQVLFLRELADHDVPKVLLNESFDEIMNQTKVRQLPPRVRFNWSNGIAAAVAFFVICGILYFIERAPNSIADLNNSAESKLVTYLNETNAVKRIELADGSTLTLEPQSMVKYPKEFEGERRSVILKGEAFFEIARDTMRPFYVFANEAVIRVLGTSFLVKAKEEDKDVEVVVRTGKVAVYKKEEVKAASGNKEQKAIPLIVTPNQKVVMKRAEQKMTKRLTVAPILLKPLDLQKQRKFENATIHQIIKALKMAYGIEINLSKDSKVDCLINTTLTDQTLFEKLDIICTPLGLSYYEENAKIIITGTCN